MSMMTKFLSRMLKRPCAGWQFERRNHAAECNTFRGSGEWVIDENALTQVTRVNFGPAIVPVPQAVTGSRKRNLFFTVTRFPSCYAFTQHCIGIGLMASNIVFDFIS
jgi:hypothetical protein